MLEKTVERLRLEKVRKFLPTDSERKAIDIAVAVYLILFALSCYLFTNPFNGSATILSEPLKAIEGFEQKPVYIFWWVVVLAMVFEFLDASAGMGYGTAITPLLLVLGFDPLQIVPAIMIQQAIAGLLGAFLHQEYGNVQWRFRKPISEPVRLCIFIAVAGCAAAVFSITSIYAVLKPAGNFIKIYVSVLLILMAVISLINFRKDREYRPSRMIFFGALAGFNKGIGGGGYGPVVTVGGLLSGVPVKNMMAVTSLSEGSVCLFSIGTWFFLMNRGTILDFTLLPSMLLGSLVSVVAAPYLVKIISERVLKFFVPVYCFALAAYGLGKVLLSL